MSRYIQINSGLFSVTTNRGKNLRFKSTDGKAYIVDCDKREELSKDLPLTVLGDNRNHQVKIDPKAGLGNYTLTVELKAPAPAGPGDLGTTPPAMIIRVE